MNNETRLLFNAYMARVGQLNRIPDASVNFNVAPTIQQKLWQKVQESSDFLKRINMPMVNELKGALIGMGITGTISGRTDTDTADRLGGDPTNLDEREYECVFTEFDVALKWALLDIWAKFPDFQTKWGSLVTNQIALELIMVGWNGTSIAKPKTDRTANPLLQDVNKGWLEKQRLENAARVMDEGSVANQLTYGGTGADYVSLDSLVYDARHGLLPTWARGDTGLVAIVGNDLLHDKYFPLINREQDAENTLATDVIMSTKRLGGLQAVEVPHFPTGTILITRFDNLSIYNQSGKHRRHIQDNPKRSRIEDYQSKNLAYVIEDLDYAALIENITPYEAPETDPEDNG
ncbi:MAG: phage major capsid protein, P2 family [Asticcacaulis sp.]